MRPDLHFRELAETTNQPPKGFLLDQPPARMQIISLEYHPSTCTCPTVCMAAVDSTLQTLHTYQGQVSLHACFAVAAMTGIYLYARAPPPPPPAAGIELTLSPHPRGRPLR